MIDHWVYESHDDGDDDDDDDDEQKDSEHEDVDKTKDEEVCTMIHWKFLVAIPLPFRISHYPADSANLCPIVPGCWIQTHRGGRWHLFFPCVGTCVYVWCIDCQYQYP